MLNNFHGIRSQPLYLILIFGNWAKNNFSEVSYWSQKLDIFNEDLKGSN